MVEIWLKRSALRPSGKWCSAQLYFEVRFCGFGSAALSQKEPAIGDGSQFGRNTGKVIQIEPALCVLPATGFVFLVVEQP
jgi:hypothetical protein